MLPLSPPNGYWRKLHSAISKFLWNNKRPRLKMSTIQQRRLDGGLAVPNFKLYFWSFSLRPLINWFNPKAVVSLHALEEELVSLWRLQDVIFTNISIKQCQLCFEPLIAYVIQIWRNSQKSCAILCPWHLDSPIFNNNQLLIGRRPIIFSQWEKKGAVMTYQAHLSFFIYNLGWPLGPMGSCGISHWNNTSSTNSPRTEELPGALLQGPSLRQTVENDVPELRLDFDWDSVWANVLLASRNPDHQQINQNFAHRIYLTWWVFWLIPDAPCVAWGLLVHSSTCSGNVRLSLVFGTGSPLSCQTYSLWLCLYQ